MHEWKKGEYWYCAEAVVSRGNDAITRDPKTIATYLRLQASRALHDGQYELSARLGAAATCINEDARNHHPPRWKAAEQIMFAIRR